MTAQVEYDEQLMQQVMNGSGADTPSAAIEAALRAYSQNLKAQELFCQEEQHQPSLKDLFGKVEFWPDYDYKAMRENPHWFEEGEKR